MARSVPSDNTSPLKRGASTALYQQIRRSILTDIWSGLYRSGDLLPSESDLSAHFGVNRLTVRQAVHALANQGFVRPLHGRGYQVTSTTLSDDVLTTTSLSHYLQELGLESETIILSTEIVVPASEVTDALGLRRGAKTVKITRHRRVLEAPIAVDEAYYDASKFEELLHIDLNHRSLLEALYRVFDLRIGRTATELRAELANGRAELLGVSPSDPVLLAKSVMYDLNDNAVECGFAYYHRDRVKLTFSAPIDPGSWPYGGLPVQG